MKKNNKNNKKRTAPRGGGFKSSNLPLTFQPMGGLGLGDVIVKKMTIPGLMIVSSAGGVINLSTSNQTGTVQSNPATEWASFAARYQQYRVRKLVIQGKACLPVNTTAAIHGALYISDFIGSSTPSSSAQVYSDERSIVVPTYRDFSYVATWSRNPNARLWNPTSASVPTANEYGIAYASAGNPSLGLSLVYYALSVEFEVELRGAQ